MFDRRGGKMLFFQPLRKQLIAVYAGKAHGQPLQPVPVTLGQKAAVQPELQQGESVRAI